MSTQGTPTITERPGDLSLWLPVFQITAGLQQLNQCFLSWKPEKHPRSIQKRLLYPFFSGIFPALDLVDLAYLLGSFQILLGTTKMATRAMQVSSSDKAGCMSGRWKGQVLFGLTEWGQGGGASRFVYALGSLERAQLELVLAKNKCSHYLSWKDILVSEQ